jgi:glycosyltransferase involved in cell wall biosynthesis
MNVLLVHNYYQGEEGKLGEGVVVRGEKELLVSGGHRVSMYIRDNDEISSYSALRKATLPLRTLWSGESYSAIRALLRTERPDIAHFHNTFPLISPAAYYACKDAAVPIVQSLHNGRLFCCATTFYRKGKLCHDCLRRRVAWPAVVHRCYRNSRLQSGVVAAMLAAHHYLGSWARLVDRFVVFTEFYKQKFVDAGLPADKIVVKAHHVEEPRVREGVGSYAVFIGRLVPEKGVKTLLKAWAGMSHIPLRIRGEGLLAPDVREQAARSNGAIEMVPRPTREGLFELLRHARFLVWPSEFYETFGLVAAEAFACGVPVIGSALPPMEEMVSDGRTGLTFRAGDSDDLAGKVRWAWEHPDEMAAMGRAARREYEQKYTSARNYAQTMELYRGLAS